MTKQIVAIITIHSFGGSMYEATEPEFTFSYSDLKTAEKVVEEINDSFDKNERGGRDGYMAILHDLKNVNDHDQTSQGIIEEHLQDIFEDYEDEDYEDEEDTDVPHVSSPKSVKVRIDFLENCLSNENLSPGARLLFNTELQQLKNSK